MVLQSRDTFKTSIALGKAVQWILNNRDIELGIGSDKIERSGDRVKILKATFESCEPLKYLYPDVCYKEPLLESDKWTESEFNVKRSPYRGGTRMSTVTAFGFFPLPTGDHYDAAIIDDLENEQNTNTDELVIQLNQRLVAFTPVLKSGGQMILVGTVYHDKGPNLLASQVWPSYRVPIIDKVGNPTFPSRFPLEKIVKKREEILRIDGPYVWHTQYLLQPHPRTHAYFFPFRDVTLNSFTLERA